jgi:hypothetical protein
MQNNPELKKRGRKSETLIPTDDQYFNAYYHQTKKDVTCECGMTVLSRCMLRHLKRKIHFKRLANVAEPIVAE